MSTHDGHLDGAVQGVVLLHGMARTPASMRCIERMLAAEGYRTLNLSYDSRRKGLEALSDEIHPVVDAFAAGLDEPAHVVTHSMGGLLARVYIALKRPPRLGRVVMLAPPNHGSAVADRLHRTFVYRAVFGPAGQQLTTGHAAVLQGLCRPVDYELGIIAGTRSIDVLSSALLLPEANDGKVTVRSTRLEGMTDHIALPATHTFMTRNRAVLTATLAFLRHGRFG